MGFNRYNFDTFLLKTGCVGFFDPPITLKSGRPGHFYFNFRNLVSTAALKNQLVELMGGYIRDNGLEPDYFIGVPEGATKLGLFLSDKYGKGKLPMGRGKPKAHGEPKDRNFIGPVEKGDHVVLLEDVTTTGGSLFRWVDKLYEVEAVIDCTLVIGNRLELTEDMRPVADVIIEKGTKYNAMTDASTLLLRAFEEQKPGSKVGKRIEDYYDKFGAIKIKYREGKLIVKTI